MILDMSQDFDQLKAELHQRITNDSLLSSLNPFKLALPSVRFRTRRVPDKTVKIGQTRIGGLPDLPEGFEWPTWKPKVERDDKFGGTWNPSSPAPLGFIAQIDLAEIPHLDTLPTRGWLCFFYDRYCEAWG